MLLSDKLLQIVHLVGCNVKRIAVAIFKDDVFLFEITRFEDGRPLANAHAVNFVHDVIAGLGRKSLLGCLDGNLARAAFAYALARADKTGFDRRIYKSGFHLKRSCQNAAFVVAVLAVSCVYLVFSEALDDVFACSLPPHAITTFVPLRIKFFRS